MTMALIAKVEMAETAASVKTAAGLVETAAPVEMTAGLAAAAIAEATLAQTNARGPRPGPEKTKNESEPPSCWKKQLPKKTMGLQRTEYSQVLGEI